MATTIRRGFCCLIIAQVTLQFVTGVPVSTVQKISGPSVEGNTLEFLQEENHVLPTTLAELGDKYSFANVSLMMQTIRHIVNTIRHGEQADFLRTRMEAPLFQEIDSKLNNSIAETESITREAEYLNGKRMRTPVILLRRLIKKISNVQRSLSESFKDLSAALRTASVGSQGYTKGLQPLLLQAYYELSSYVCRTASEESDHDWRNLDKLAAV